MSSSPQRRASFPLAPESYSLQTFPMQATDMDTPTESRPSTPAVRNVTDAPQPPSVPACLWKVIHDDG
ncbi:hypothetical protein BD414DRAFT_503778 [Trametes punicea]|nr:hypothetical protein BD414DRAFT_503778 [Trametes punicea]